MDKISFTGLKNMCYAVERFRDTEDIVSYERWMNVALTGKDLHTFRMALRKSGLPKRIYTNPVQKNFLNINTFSTKTEDCIAVNDALLQADDSTLPMFSALAKITRKISRKNENEFMLEKQYINSKKYNNSLIIDKEFSNEYCEQFHNPSYVKKGAEKINKAIQRIMERYFSQ